MLFDSIISGLNQLALKLAEVEAMVAQVSPVQLTVPIVETTFTIPTSNQATIPLSSNIVSTLPMRLTTGDPIVRATSTSQCIKGGVIEVSMNVA